MVPSSNPIEIETQQVCKECVKIVLLECVKTQPVCGCWKECVKIVSLEMFLLHYNLQLSLTIIIVLENYYSFVLGYATPFKNGRHTFSLKTVRVWS